MIKEYQDAMQEEFKAWYINADLAGQSYGMIDCWQAACKWATKQQIENDAHICWEIERVRGQTGYSHAIRNQATRSEDQENE